MKTRSLCFAVAGVLALASAVQAHFVWVAVANEKGGQAVAQVWFSELAEPDSADLLDKILMVQVVSFGADQKPQPVKVIKHASEQGGGALVGTVPADTKALAAHIKYGVLTRGPQTFLLQYYAKYLDASAADLTKLAGDKRLTLDVVPHKTEKGYSLEVLYKGQPVAGSEVVLHDPSGNQTEAKSDEKGRVELVTTKQGLYSVRAKWLVAESGKEGDKEYAQVNHYSTLALRVPSRE
jgi:uncharacterized GH25 family protein